ncbi:hypothetical protein ACJMK2_019875 [Sinanodonta woodiana]|uniref:Uncharacterized protein n=1 Tax=Sinanodonta woodiana TaxID=1069815 RepID=A0ABD3TX95_SINWO
MDHQNVRLMEKTFRTPNHSNQLLIQMSELWRESKYCDAVIHMRDAQYKIHKLVLIAACPEILNHLAHRQENEHLNFYLPDDVSPRAVETVLEYLYAGTIHLKDENVKQVEKVAELLQVGPLIRYCLDFVALNDEVSEYWDGSDFDDDDSNGKKVAGKIPRLVRRARRGRQRMEEMSYLDLTHNKAAVNQPPIMMKEPQNEAPGMGIFPTQQSYRDTFLSLLQSDQVSVDRDSGTGISFQDTLSQMMRNGPGPSHMAVTSGSSQNVSEAAGSMRRSGTDDIRADLSTLDGILPEGISLEDLLPQCAGDKRGQTLAELDSPLKQYIYNKALTCNVCNKTFKYVKTLQNHKKIHSLEDLQEQNVCLKDPHAEEPARKHINWYKKAFFCNECGKSFGRKKALEEHSHVHIQERSAKKMKYKCPYPGCSFSCETADELTSHADEHLTHVKPFQCSKCPETFYSEHLLKQHEPLFHGMDGKCDQCERYFNTEDMLSKHKKKVHEGTQFYCKHCNYCYKSSLSLKKHEERHKLTPDEDRK